MISMNKFIFKFIASTLLLWSLPSQALQCWSPSKEDLAPEVSLYKWSPQKVEKQALIIPPTGGMNFTDRHLARQLCKAGIQVLILNYSQNPAVTTDLGVHDRYSQEALNYIDLALGTHPQPTALIGASLGGLYSALAFGNRKSTQLKNLSWLERLVVTVTGGPLHQILAESQLEGVISQRELRKAHYQLTSDSSYNSFLKSHITLDPLAASSPLDRDRILFFGSTEDTIVPAHLQKQLWQKMGEPESLWLDSSHAWMIGRVYLFETSKIAEFVKRPIAPY